MLLWVMKLQSMGRKLGQNYIITEFKGSKFIPEVKFFLILWMKQNLCMNF